MGAAGLDLTSVFKAFEGKPKQTVKIPLACFTAKGLKLFSVDTPFSVSADAPFAAAFANMRIVGGAARDKDALDCAQLK